jgi:hypothetical protein
MGLSSNATLSYRRRSASTYHHKSMKIPLAARQCSRICAGWIWIDTLSVGQSDPCEKLEQVKIISSVFAGTQQTIVWLGPTHGDSDNAMKALLVSMSKRFNWKTPRALRFTPRGLAMLGLCERRYQHRLWVFQELRASQKVDILNGSQQVGLKDLRDFLLRDHCDVRTKGQVRSLQRSPAVKMVNLTIEAGYAAKSNARCDEPFALRRCS